MDLINRKQTPSSKQMLLALKEAKSQLTAARKREREPIAVIGLACRFPGADTPQAFWHLLQQGKDMVAEIPQNRWDVNAYYSPEPATPGKSYVRHGAFIDDVDQFDPQFFGISPREAVSLDPQQRLLLEVSWEALEQAGQPPTQLAGSRTGIFVGIGSNEYAQVGLGVDDAQRLDAYRSTGNGNSFASGRLSYILGLQGPSLAIDTACSSSLVAVHQACQSLRAQECDMALAGGVQLMLLPDGFVILSQMQALAADGRCKTFDALADGYGRGEGCGMVVLKRLSDAVAAGDNILAVIRGSAINHDGPSSGLTVPNKQAQEMLIRQALVNARLEPEMVSYVDAHGTGTSLGDPIELRALSAVYSVGRERPLLVGAVKTNIGHLEAAAGIAGLIKVVLSLHHGQIPPHLHFERPTPYLEWESLPVQVPTELMAWPAEHNIAGVSAFGMSGTNAHILVESAPPIETKTDRPERPWHLLTLSAKTRPALIALARRYAEFLANPAVVPLGDVCYTANVGRSHFGHRLSLTANSGEQMRSQLAAFVEGQTGAGVSQGAVTAPRAVPKVAFLFTAAVGHYIKLGRELYEDHPIFRQSLERCNEILSSNEQISLPDILSANDQSKIDDTVLFALSYALADLWKSWGIEPDVVMGQGVGEVVAACVAGVFNLEDGLKLVGEWNRLTTEGTSRTKEFEQAARSISYRTPKVGLISTPTGESVTDAVTDPSYWVWQPGGDTNLTAVMAKLDEQGIDLVLEIGSRTALLHEAQIWLSDQEKMNEHEVTASEIEWLSSLDPGRSAWQQMLESLGRMYTRGVKVDWAGYNRAYYRRKVPLPTYPFQRERYWVDVPPRQPKRELLRPLIERMIASPLIEGIIFETEYSLERLPFLADHHVFGEVVVPGVSHISMVLSAIELAFDQPQCRLKDIVFPQALVLADQEIRTVQLLIRLESGTATFQVISTEKSVPNDEPVTHAVGNIIIGQPDNPAPIIIQTVQKRCTKSLTHEAFYDAFHKMVEIRYGPRFRWIDTVWIGPDETLGRLRLPAAIDSVAGYQLYPSLIDACTQLITAATLDEGAIDTVIPFSIETFRFYRSVDQRLLWSYAKQVGEKEWDIQLLDHTGQLVADMTGFILRPVPPAAIRSRQRYLKRFGYIIEWQVQPIQNKSGESSGIVGNWLIIGRPDGLGEVLATQLQALGAHAVLVTNPNQTDDLQTLLQTAPDTADRKGWDGIVLLGEIETMTGAVSTVPDMAEKLCSRALRLVQALEKVGPDTRLWLVTEGCQNIEEPPQQSQGLAIDPSRTIALAAAHGALWGLGRTIGTEYPQLHCTCVDLEGVEVKSEVQSLLAEFRFNAAEVQVAYRQGIRYVARLARWHESRAKESTRSIEIQKNGSYLITGGLGALGWQVAQQLAAAGAGHLILAGRGGLKGEVDRAQIRLLEEAGARVHVVQADVSQREEVARLLQTCEAQRPLRGIIHAAGILDDGVLGRQTPERFAKVMAPKVRGAWHLHILSQAHPLDFFICFSSMAAWLGSAGQGNYVAANAFMDTLMSHRRMQGLPGLSISWGPWAEAGMAAHGSNGRRNWWHGRGLNPITTEQGRSVLSECLNQDVTPVGILSVDWPIFLKDQQTNSLFYEKMELPAAQRKARPAEMYEQLKAVSANERHSVLKAYLHGQLVEVIGLRSDQQIGAQQPLFDLGIDSLLALELRNRLETDLGYSLPSTVIFDYPTLDTLTEFLISKLFREVSEDVSPKAGDELDPTLLAEIDQLSDDELAAAIDAEFNALLSQDKEV